MSKRSVTSAISKSIPEVDFVGNCAMIDRIFTESIFQRKNVMAIQMIGIDHSVAAIDIRTVFSFTQKKKTVEALEIIKQEKGICGCVLLFDL